VPLLAEPLAVIELRSHLITHYDISALIGD